MVTVEVQIRQLTQSLTTYFWSRQFTLVCTYVLVVKTKLCRQQIWFLQLFLFDLHKVNFDCGTVLPTCRMSGHSFLFLVKFQILIPPSSLINPPLPPPPLFIRLIASFLLPPPPPPIDNSSPPRNHRKTQHYYYYDYRHVCMCVSMRVPNSLVCRVTNYSGIVEKKSVTGRFTKSVHLISNISYGDY